MADTLYDFYTGQGQNLPSIADRAKAFESAGIGSATDYQGTATQNTALLDTLQNPITEADAQAVDVNAPIQPNPNVVETEGQASLNNIATDTIKTTDQLIAEQKQARTDDIAGVTGLTDEYSKLLDQTTNKQSDLYSAEQEAGVPEMSKQVLDLNNQMRNIQASLNLGQANQEGKVIPMKFITGRTAQMQRQASAQLGALAVQSQAVQGNIALAKSTAESLINAQYAPIEQEIANQKEIIALNYQNLSITDQARADELNRLYATKSAELADEKETRQQISNIGIKLAEYGVDSETVGNVLNAGSIDDAIEIAGSKLQSPQDKLQLESIKLDQTLTRAQIAKTNYDMYISQKYGGLTPSQFNANLKAEQKAINEADAESEKSQLQAESLNEKITLLDGLLESKALDSVVGPTPFARKATSFWGAVSRGPFALQGIKDVVTGADDIFLGKTEQMISKEFLDSLISVKAQGGTFGALQKAEQDALTNAATAIGFARITKGKGEDKKVVGYDMSEKDFKNEINIIKQSAQLAYERAVGKTFVGDESQFLDDFFTEETAQPFQYFN